MSLRCRAVTYSISCRFLKDNSASLPPVISFRMQKLLFALLILFILAHTINTKVRFLKTKFVLHVRDLHNSLVHWLEPLLELNSLILNYIMEEFALCSLLFCFWQLISWFQSSLVLCPWAIHFYRKSCPKCLLLIEITFSECVVPGLYSLQQRSWEYDFTSIFLNFQAYIPFHSSKGEN